MYIYGYHIKHQISKYQTTNGDSSVIKEHENKKMANEQELLTKWWHIIALLSTQVTHS